MNSVYFCIFTLFILVASTQAKDDATSKLHKSIEGAASAIAKQVGSMIEERRASVLTKIDNEIQSLSAKPDHCSSNKAKKINNLRTEFKGLDSCTIVVDVVNTVEGTIVNGTHLVLDTIGNTVGIVSGTISCLLTHPDPLSCAIGQVERLLKGLVSTVPRAISFVVSTVLNVASLVHSLLKCLNIQKGIEQRFHEIRSTPC